MAPGSFTVLCSYAYFRRTSRIVGLSPRSRRSFNCSLVMRSTGTALFSLCLGESSRCGENLRRASLCGRFPREKRQRAWRSGGVLSRQPRRHGHQRPRLIVDGPSVRPLSTMDAAEKDGSGRTADAEIMAPREVTVQPIPHVSLNFSSSLPLLIAKPVPPAMRCVSLEQSAFLRRK